MYHSEFRLGLEFSCSGRRWRCTDVGSRVAVAIRVDETTIGSLDPVSRKTSQRTISGEDAEREGWFDGPTYAVLGIVLMRTPWAAARWSRTTADERSIPPGLADVTKDRGLVVTEGEREDACWRLA